MKLVYAIFMLMLISSSCSLADESDAYLKGKARDFLTALLSIDEETLATKYASNSKSFTKEGKLNREIYSFLYDDKDGEYLPVTKIVSSSDAYIKVIPQGQERYIALFMREKLRENASSISFLENEWMKKYFACEFELANGELTFYQNICFAESGGPFPPDYGM